jgi:inhibitor of cysteine peptidase
MSARPSLAPFISVLCIVAVLFAGCTGPVEKTLPAPVPATPAPTPPLPAAETNSFDQSDTGGTYPVAFGSEIQLRLPENPTTGFTWNLSVSPGLSVVNDTYVPDDVSGKLVGSGGVHVWVLSATGAGDQVVSGAYRRPWEPPTGNATMFSLSLIVSESSCGGNVCTLPPAGPAVPPRYPVYTERDNGRAVQEPLGETFGLRLPENPATGYSWNLSIPAGLTLSRDEYLPSSTGVQVVGAGGTRSFTMGAAKTGGWNITAEYRRPWVTAGTVIRVDLEGGFYGILGDDGKKYEPLSLDARYQKDGLRIAFDAAAAKDAVTTRMWGTPVNLAFIEEIRVFSLGVIVS